MAAGQLLLTGLEDSRTGVAFEQLSDEQAAELADLSPGGVVLYGNSFQSIEQVTALVGEAGAALAIAPFVGVDYEGGFVSRLTDTGGIPATAIPTAREIGRRVSEGAVSLSVLEALGEVMGAELRAVGANMNFAPVADVDPADGVGAIGRDARTFGNDPVLVGEIAGALISGMQRQGVAAVVKHFPGHGGVADDSHLTLPTLDAERSVLQERDLAAFEVVFDSRPAAIMTAHMSVPALDPTMTPATLSVPVLTGVLRQQFGYEGLVITDALNMRAMTDYASEDELVILSIEAGADLILKPVDAIGARDAIVDAVLSGRLNRERIDESVARILRSKVQLGVIAPFPDRTEWPIGTDAHAAVVREILGE
jgi:beta-N-acetylhexosaminidase